MSSEMEVMEVHHQDHLQLVVEKRKWKTELENKKRQLEDDRRALQHLKSKALRERWLLEGSSADGADQDQILKQLTEDEAKTRSLEEAICRLEQELISLETGSVCQTVTHTDVTSGSNEALKVKGHSGCQLGKAKPLAQVIPAPADVKVHKSFQISKSREIMGEMKKAMYSVEIKVERDRATGETRVLSTNTTLPVDLCDQGVKVYEDEQKVVHEMNGEDGVHLLSSSEVDELIHKADEMSMMSQTVATVTSRSRAEVPDPQQSVTPGSAPVPCVTPEITGLEAEASGEPGVAEVSDENPVTMVFMGYQDVEDEDETKKLLGLQGTVKAELVLIDDVDKKVDPSPPTFATPPTSAEPLETMEASDGAMAEEVKKKQPYLI